MSIKELNMRQTKDQKAKAQAYAHHIMSIKVAEYRAAGIDPRFANYTQNIQQAQAVIDAGLTFDQWLPWRQERWDLERYPVMTPKVIAGFVSRGMSITEAKRDMSRTYPAPMQTR
jgi:hypothetical protein